MNESPMERDELIQKYIHIFSYWKEINGKIATLNLWLNGIRIFSNATCIKRYSELKKIEFSSTQPPDVNQLMPFVNDNIIDKTRIIMCFENFMKGSLILNGYLAHLISKNHKELQQKQKEKPIKAADVLTEKSFVRVDSKSSSEIDVLPNTVSFSWMLKPKYQEILNLPTDIQEILAEMNSERNRLHFMSIEKYIISRGTLRQLEKLSDFVEKVITPRMVDLDNSMKELEHPEAIHSR